MRSYSNKGQVRRLPMALSALACMACAGGVLAENNSLQGENVIPQGMRGTVPGQLIVAFDNLPGPTTLAALQQQFPVVEGWRDMNHAAHAKGQPGVPHPLAYVRILTFDKSVDVEALADAVAQLNGVRFAEPNGYTEIALVPNDPFYNSQQYGPQIINSEAAWDIELGDSNIVLAVADTGINFGHEDLAPGIWVNPGEIANNGIDDDNNGYVDDVNGWDHYNNDNNPNDGHGHGSHVAGSAAARTNNAKGIAGMAQVQIMPLQVFSSGGGGTWDAIANAVFYATDNGASVLNYSGGGFGGSNLLSDSCDYAWNNGMSVVAAAGNYGSSTEFYPAAYTPVLAIAATDAGDNRASFSNYGNWLDVAAPGVDIYSCSHSGSSSYYYNTGTSMASPHAAGLVALMYSVDPSLTPQQVRDLLRNNAVDLGSSGFDIYYGYGRIDALATLQAIGPSDCLTLTVANLNAGNIATWTATGVSPGQRAAIVYGFQAGSTVINGYGGYCASFGIQGVNNNRVIGQPVADGGGVASVSKSVPGGTSGTTVLMQAAEKGTCPNECVSNVLTEVIG